MITRHEVSGITWVDMESPSRTELQEIIAEFNIDARIEEEIVSPTPYPLVVDTEKYVYLVLHFPTTDPNGGAKSQEIDFIAGKNFLITCRYEVITTIHSLHKIFEAEELLGITKHRPSTADLIERILRQLYSSISEEAEQFARMLERIEEDIFSGRERSTVRNISLVGRVLLRFDTTLSRHTEPLKEFLKQLGTPAFFGKSFTEHAAHIEAEHTHAINVVSSYREVALELRETNDSILSTAQNEIIQRLTIITFAAVPLTVITGLFGMSIGGIPLAESPNAFWTVVVIMVLMVLALLAYFKAKKWI
jgi:magnesium/cobalt transport protein CorA